MFVYALKAWARLACCAAPLPGVSQPPGLICLTTSQTHWTCGAGRSTKGAAHLRCYASCWGGGSGRGAAREHGSKASSGYAGVGRPRPDLVKHEFLWESHFRMRTQIVLGRFFATRLHFCAASVLGHGVCLVTLAAAAHRWPRCPGEHHRAGLLTASHTKLGVDRAWSYSRRGLRSTCIGVCAADLRVHAQECLAMCARMRVCAYVRACLVEGAGHRECKRGAVESTEPFVVLLVFRLSLEFHDCSVRVCLVRGVTLLARSLLYVPGRDVAMWVAFGVSAQAAFQREAHTSILAKRPHRLCSLLARQSLVFVSGSACTMAPAHTRHCACRRTARFHLARMPPALQVRLERPPPLTPAEC